MVGHDDGGKHGEALFGVEAALVAVCVDAGQFDLVSRLTGVAQVA